MPDRPLDEYQVLVTPDPRTRNASTALWRDAAHGSWTEDDPTAGDPEPSGDYDAVLEAEGVCAADEDIWVRARNGGPIGRTQRSGTFTWRRDGDAATEERGWEPPSVPQAWENLLNYTSPTTAHEPHPVTLTTDAYRDRVVMVHERDTGDIECEWRDPDTGTWTTGIVVHDAQATSVTMRGYFPCLVEAGERLYCLHWVPGHAAASTAYYLRVQVSLDGGATWTTARDYATEERDVLVDWTAASAAGAGNYALGRLAAAYKDGQVAVFAHLQEGVSGSVNADCIRQWASSDLSTQLVAVSTTASSEGNGPVDVAVVRGAFVVVYLAPGGGSALRTRRLGSAFTPFDNATELQASPWSPNNLASYGTTPTRVTAAELSLVADDAGILWVFVQSFASGATADISFVGWSDNGGRDWSTVGIEPTDPTNLNGTAVWFRPDPAASSGIDHHPRAFRGTFQRGRVLMAHNWDAAVATNDGSLSVLYLGGYHTFTVPPTRDGARLPDRASWASTRLPLERAVDTAAWTTTTIGTAFDLLVAGAERFVSGDGAGASGYYYAQQNDSTTGDVAWIGTWTCAVEDGDRTTGWVEMRVRIDDGTHGVEISVRQDDDGFRVRDMNAGTDLLDVPNLKEHAAQEFRLGVYRSEDGTSRGWHLQYREADTSEDKVWTVAGSGSLADATVTANNYVRYGNHVSAGATTTVKSTWYHGPSFSFGDITGINSLAGSADCWHDWVAADNPGRLAGRPLAGSPLYVAGGVRVRGVDGPLLAGQLWRIRPRFGWPVERIFPDFSRSPRVPWQAADEAQQIVPVVLDAGLLDTADSHAGAPLLALVLAGINWRTATLQMRSAGGSWSDAVDIDASIGALSYTRQGATLLPSADASLNLARHELVGFDARLGSTVRRVKGNRNGRWGTGTAAGPRARVDLDGVQGADPASGTVHLCARGLVALFHVPSTADTMTAWRLVIDAQGTVEGKLQTGAAWLGQGWLAARAPDWGSSERWRPGHRVREADDLTSRVARPAPGRQEVQLAWPNDIDTTQWHSSDEPDWRSIASSGSTLEGVATLAGTVYDLQGEVEALEGHPVAYCPRVPRETLGTVTTLRRRHEWLYASVEGDLRISEGLGDARTRTLTIGSVDLVEVP